jgi:hypothetical protein
MGQQKYKIRKGWKKRVKAVLTAIGRSKIEE